MWKWNTKKYNTQERLLQTDKHRTQCESNLTNEVWYKSAFKQDVEEAGVTHVTWVPLQTGEWHGYVNIKGPRELIKDHMRKTHTNEMSATCLTVSLVTGYADQVIYWRWDVDLEKLNC